MENFICFNKNKFFYNRVSTQALQANQALFLTIDRVAMKVFFPAANPPLQSFLN
jgi:hypothetical protein